MISDNLWDRRSFFYRLSAHHRVTSKNVVFVSLLILICIPVILTACLLCTTDVYAETEIGGIISQDTTWTLADSPYIVTGGVVVNGGVTLTIEPGVMVRFDSGISLQINGKLIAEGTDDNKITFTSNLTSQAAGDWGSITFADSSVDDEIEENETDTSGSIVKYCNIEFGGDGSNGLIQIDSSSPSITNSKITNSLSAGIYIDGGAPLIDNNTVINCTKGIYSSANSIIVNNTLKNNIYGAYLTSHETFSNNLISDNTSDGLYTTGGCGYSGTISGNVVKNNDGWGIYSSSSCGGVYILNNIVISNDEGGISLNTGNSVSNNIIASNNGRGFSSSHATPTLTNNTITTNIGDYAIYFAPYSGARDIKYNNITHNTSTSAAVFLHAWTTDAGLPLFNNNSLFNNTALYEVINDYNSTKTLSSNDNYWGTSLESEIQGKIYDWNDDSSIAIIDYYSYLTQPDITVPCSPPYGVIIKSIEFSGVTENVTITWSPNPESDLAGYRVYWDISDNYPLQNSIDVGNVTTYTLTDIPQGAVIAVTSYDTDYNGANDATDTIVNENQTQGHESWYSFAHSTNKIYVTIQPFVKYTQYKLELIGEYDGGQYKLGESWTSSDTSVATMEGNTLTAQQNGRVTVSTEYDGKTYQGSVFLLDTDYPDDFEGAGNDIQAQADVLPAGEFWKAEMLTDDIDYYQLSLDENALIEVAYLTTSTNADTKIEVLDSEGTTVAQAISTDGALKVVSCGLSKGINYIRLTSAGDIDQDIFYHITWATAKYIQLGGIIPISIGESKEETLYSLSDTTTFAFDLSEKNAIKLSFNPTSYVADYKVELLDETQQILCTWTSTDGAYLLMPVSLNAGNYSLKVSHIQDVDATSPFTVSLIESGDNFETEPNNTGIKATQMAKDLTINGLLTSGDIDIYSFSLNYPKVIKLSFDSESINGDYQIILCKGKEDNAIDGTISTDGQSVGLEVGLTSGFYLVKVIENGDLDDQSLYSLTLSDSDKINLEIEPNDNKESANGLDNSSEKQGRIYSVQDMDYFGFTMPEEKLVTIDFSSNSTIGDYVVHVLNGADSEIYQKEALNGSNVTINIKPKPGTYYVRVKAQNDVDPYNNYTLSMTTTASVTALIKLSALNLIAEKTSLDISENLQLAVHARYSDATALDITSSASYVSSDPSVLSISQDGIVTGLSDGTAIITVTYQGKASGITFTVGTPVQEGKQNYGNLIIVAGGALSESDSLKEATLYITDLAYQKFKARNFTDEDIYFITQTPFHDLDGDGYDDKIVDDLTPTVAGIQFAITGWGKEQPSPS